MNATFDGARIHQQELDREIDSLRTERFLNGQAAQRPGPMARGLALGGAGDDQRRDGAREPRRRGCRASIDRVRRAGLTVRPSAGSPSSVLDHDAALHHDRHVGQHADVRQRIACHGHEVGGESGASAARRGRPSPSAPPRRPSPSGAPPPTSSRIERDRAAAGR